MNTPLDERCKIRKTRKIILGFGVRAPLPPNSILHLIKTGVKSVVVGVKSQVRVNPFGSRQYLILLVVCASGLDARVGLARLCLWWSGELSGLWLVNFRFDSLNCRVYELLSLSSVLAVVTRV